MNAAIDDVVVYQPEPASTSAPQSKSKSKLKSHSISPKHQSSNHALYDAASADEFVDIDRNRSLSRLYIDSEIRCSFSLSSLSSTSSSSSTQNHYDYNDTHCQFNHLISHNPTGNVNPTSTKITPHQTENQNYSPINSITKQLPIENNSINNITNSTSTSINDTIRTSTFLDSLCTKSTIIATNHRDTKHNSMQQFNPHSIKFDEPLINSQNNNENNNIKTSEDENINLNHQSLTNHKSTNQSSDSIESNQSVGR
jgi:hypothetical protein